MYRRNRNKQPQHPVGINKDLAITQGLVFLAPLNPLYGYQNLVTGETLTRSGSLDPAFSRGGVYPTFSSTSYIAFDPTLGGLTYTTPTTVAWTQEPRGTSAYNVQFVIRATGSANAFSIFSSTSDSNYYFVVGVGNGSFNLNYNFSSPVGATTNNVYDRFCLILPSGFSTGANAILYRNGKEMIGSAAISSNSFSTNTLTGARIGISLSGSNPFEGLLGNFHIWNRTLTRREAILWTNNEFITLENRKFVPIAVIAASVSSPYQEQVTFFN